MTKKHAKLTSGQIINYLMVVVGISCVIDVRYVLEGIISRKNRYFHFHKMIKLCRYNPSRVAKKVVLLIYTAI